MIPKKTIKNTPVAGGLGNLSPKTMVMIVLLAVMGILWGRVLLKGKSGPATASAQDMAALQQFNQANQHAVVQIDAIALPQIPGRNDVLSRDIFSTENWTAAGFGNSTNDHVSGVQVDALKDSVEHANQLKLAQIAKRLTLEAVIQDADGIPSQAFVDGKILSVGSALTVQEGPDQYELTLDEITYKKVVFSWNKVSVVLEMAEAFEF
jgi:hypothetical protein